MAYRVGVGAVLDRAGGDDWAALAALPSLVPALPDDLGDLSPSPPLQPGPPACPEIDCVRHLLPKHLLDAAERRAEWIGVGADRVLIAWGVISEDTYVAALAASLGMAFEPLFNTRRDQCPLPDGQLAHAANTGMLPLNDRHGVGFVVAPRLVDSRRLVELATSGHDIAQRIRITSAARLHAFIARHSAREIERRAIDDLRLLRPELSAGVSGPRRMKVAGYALAAVTTAVAFPDVAIVTIQILLGFVFLAWTGLRLLGLLSERFIRHRPRTFADDGLPVYSIVIALHREAAAVSGLVASLRALNYPLEKLDIKLVVEPDDRETQQALSRLQLGPPFEIIVAPRGGPRTKPKALNAALPFVRGKFVAVFDAEDRPERDQLRLALEAFGANDERLACVQARLTIDNTADSWLTRGIMAQTPQAVLKVAA
jgi:glycosyltransferase XagB